MAVRAKCQDCGKRFAREKSETWKTFCYACWKARQDRQTRQDSPQVKELQALNSYLQKRLSELREHINFLVFACHPDRNPGHQDQATRATAWLLDFKNGRLT